MYLRDFYQQEIFTSSSEWWRICSLIEGGLMMTIADFAIAGLTLFLIILYVICLSFHKRRCLPPGPLAWPIIGHIHLLDANRPLHQTLFDLARRYGHIILLQLGSCKVLIVTSSELARECLTTHDLNFASRPRFYMGNADEVEELKEMINTHFKLMGAFNVGDYIPFLRSLDLQGCERAMKKYSRRRDEILQRLIDRYRLSTKKKNDECLIDVLIHLVDKGDEFCSDDSIVKATIASMLLGAIDTSASTTEWAISSLLQHPEVLERAQEELDVVVGRERVLDESDLPSLKYLEAIVKETLRLYPAGPLLLPHMAKEACTVGGYYVPAQTQLLVNVWGIHRDPAEWERPLEFEPERFMNSSSCPDVNGRDFKYMPFGYGRRACPGMWVAIRMVKFTVGKLLQSFDWSIPHGVEGVDMSEGRAVTLSKAVPLKAAIKPRLPHHLY